MYMMSTTSLEWLSVISQVMYRPSTDLDGIPGAKSLVVCLTGYQRQDRDDIMVGISLSKRVPFCLSNLSAVHHIWFYPY